MPLRERLVISDGFTNIRYVICAMHSENRGTSEISKQREESMCIHLMQAVVKMQLQMEWEPKPNHLRHHILNKSEGI